MVDVKNFSLTNREQFCTFKMMVRYCSVQCKTTDPVSNSMLLGLNGKRKCGTGSRMDSHSSGCYGWASPGHWGEAHWGSGHWMESYKPHV